VGPLQLEVLHSCLPSPLLRETILLVHQQLVAWLLPLLNHRCIGARHQRLRLLPILERTFLVAAIFSKQSEGLAVNKGSKQHIAVSTRLRCGVFIVSEPLVQLSHDF
jgi:hypothetical protein